MNLDLFCQVVDNYGDIGVCWRLAQQLQRQQQGISIRLFVDDLAAFHRIEPRINPQSHSQTVKQIHIQHWSQAEISTPAPLVIEAFACELPLAYKQAMPNQTRLWINLEYLSAESWVESSHALPSPQPNGVLKYFFFPGFTPKTGGLLRPTATPNPELLDKDFWNSLGLIQAPATDRVAFVFCYEHASLELLYRCLAAQPHSWCVLLAASAPEPIAPPATLTVHRLPFIAQAQFDALLDYADFNLIRGEDSFVRAIWAQKPFIWQPYRQDDNYHLQKLQAWLSTTPFSPSRQKLIMDWNCGQLTSAQLNTELKDLSDWRQQCVQYAHTLAQQTDLATQLLAFCSQISQKTVK